MDTRPDLQGLATFVRERRRALGLTQCQLGERIDWAQERVSLLERGGYGLPSLIILARLARALGNPLSDLVSALGYDEIASAGLDQGEQESAACATLLYALEQFLTIRPGGLKEVMSQASDVAARAMGAEMVEVFVHQSSCSGLVALGSSGTELAIRQRELGLARLPVDASGRIAEVLKTGSPMRPVTHIEIRSYCEG